MLIYLCYKYNNEIQLCKGVFQNIFFQGGGVKFNNQKGVDMLNDLIKPVFPLMDIEYDKSIIDLNEAILKTMHDCRTAGITVEAGSDVLTASHFLKIYKHYTRKGEEIRKKCVEPFNSAVKDINGFFKKIYSIYSAEESRLEKELLCFNERQIKKAEDLNRENQRIIEEAAIQKAIEIEEAQITELENNGLVGEQTKYVEIPDVKEVQNYAPKLSSINVSGITTARIKKWRVTDIAIVPREYLIVNESLINNLRKGFGHDAASPIKGIEFYYETIIK